MSAAKEVDAWRAGGGSTMSTRRATMLEETTVPRSPVCAKPSGTPLSNDAIAEAASGSVDTDQYEEIVYPQPETTCLTQEGGGLCHTSEIVINSSRSQGRPEWFAKLLSESLYFVPYNRHSGIALRFSDLPSSTAFESQSPTKAPESRVSRGLSRGMSESGIQGETSLNCFQQGFQSDAENVEQSISSEKVRQPSPTDKLSRRPTKCGRKRSCRKKEVKNQKMYPAGEHGRFSSKEASSAKHNPENPAWTKNSAISNQKTYSTGRRSRSPQEMINTRDPECRIMSSNSRQRHVKSLTDDFRGIPVNMLLQQFLAFLHPNQQPSRRLEAMAWLFRASWAAMREMGVEVFLQSSLDRSRHCFVIQMNATERFEVLASLCQGLWNITLCLVQASQARFLPAHSALSEVLPGEDLPISSWRLGSNLPALPGISSEPHQHVQAAFNIPDESNRAIAPPVQVSVTPLSPQHAPLHSRCTSPDQGAQAENARDGWHLSFLCMVCLLKYIAYIHFPCGHGSCCDCSQRLEKCHICRGAIAVCLEITNDRPPGAPPRNFRPLLRNPSPTGDTFQPDQGNFIRLHQERELGRAELLQLRLRLGTGSEPAFPDMRSLSCRRQSLHQHWRGHGNHDTLAEAGFFADRPGSSELICFHCGSGIRVSGHDSNPVSSHLKLFPLCRQSRRPRPDGRRHSV